MVIPLIHCPLHECFLCVSNLCYNLLCASMLFMKGKGVINWFCMCLCVFTILIMSTQILYICVAQASELQR